MLALLLGGGLLWTWDRSRRLQQELDEARGRVTQLTESSRLAIEDRDATIQRVKRQAESERLFAHEPLVKALAPVIDDLDRALDVSGATEHPIAVGVRMVRGHLEKALARHGVELIDARGQAFDPAEHQAVDVVESDEQAPNHVLRQWSRGVRLHGRLLRAAQVVVSSAPEAAESIDEREVSDEVSPQDRSAPKSGAQALEEAVTVSGEE